MTFKEYSPRELQQYLEKNDARPVLLDVREPWEYTCCHIPNSILVPMKQIPHAMHNFNPDQNIVVICHHGIRSRIVAGYLVRHNFTNVINLSSGIDGWAKQVDPSMPTY